MNNPIIIRLYPELRFNKRYFYCRVKIYDTRKQMHRAITKDGFGCKDMDGVSGQCSGHSVYKSTATRFRLTGQFATIWLNRDDLLINPSEIISHECVHAAMRHAANKRVDLSVIEGEEVMAYAQGEMVRQLMNRLHDIKFFQ